MSPLLAMHCQPQQGKALEAAECEKWLRDLPGWQQPAGKQEITHSFSFGNFYETMAFVNAVAWIAHREDHHPDLEVGYNRCAVRFSTHSVGGLSLNDFICAAKVNALR